MSVGGGKGGGGGTQTVINKTDVPQFISDAAQKNLNTAYDVSKNMIGPYTGQRVAGMTPNQMADINAIQGRVGATDPAFGFATRTAANVANFAPTNVNAGSLASTDLNLYMNPYTQSVLNPALAQLEIQRKQGLNQIGDQAIKTGAFGGSRQGVAEGVLNSEAARQAGDLTAQLQAQNFSQAQNAATNDINRTMQAQIANQQAGLQGAGVNLAGANAVGSLADTGQSSFLRGTAAALSGQEALQQNQQQQLDAARQAYAEQQQFPLQQLQIPLQALGATPYGQTQTQTGPGPTQNLGYSALGGAGVGAQIGSMLGMPGMGAGFGALLGMFSDENEKTDIKHLGKDPATGLDLYAYRYKGDPKSYPKVVGPMAQDIEKQYPGSTAKVGGKMVVRGSLGFGG